MNSKICLINYGAGNMASIRNALGFLRIDFFELSTGPLPDPSDHIFILPGVGSFASASLSLKQSGFNKLALVSPRLIGICLGMQLLFSDSTEGSFNEGLSLIPGNIRPISDQLPSNCGLRLPHIGWQSLSINLTQSAFTSSHLYDQDFYFVHSFMALNVPSLNVIATVSYGNVPIPAIVANNRTIGFQFHPEKSGPNGLLLLKNSISYLDSI